MDVLKWDGRRAPSQAEKRVAKSEYSHCLSFSMACTNFNATSSGVWINLRGIFPRSILDVWMNDVIVNPG